MKDLGADVLKKTLYGQVDDLSYFFEEFTYIREVKVPVRRSDGYGGFTKDHRIETPRVPGFYFMSSEDPRIKTWIAKPVGGGSLHVKVKEDVLANVSRLCIDGLAALKVIPWEPYGVALVVATDRAMIANPWLGFVPLDSIPEVNHESVGVWGEKPAAE